ncbi:TIGR03619 family F420-dependent LLM class oxidoreductase [Mycobacterium sp. ITM-2016-00317]|uniref:TIGR03619 family F420-dependent LLM class oxidoreductase n=1 Tax=Mycobacterium sp. ITM-2016-00317 TaxID=2099694 RepID=UPI000D40450E|nr:TIGR03619 family F420-dependent LLM class oxidoreductase [Mycobacterium sp. ITM-2016-00317]WNG89117.1 TIGR03619 family F420-dependent LLM class oxidoreductase [Mycobacterium sp. ITM-2016-00317]
MLIGLSTPVVVQTPAAASSWEAGAGIEDVARIAETADRLGFDFLTCSEHVAVPVEDAAVRGSVYWDPLATLGFLAARTSRIRLATSVLVLGYHHPLEIAKRYGTLDRVSGGRLVLGVGVGSLRAEFDLLGAAWEDRGARADDAIRALRASLSTPEPSYQGEFHRYRGMTVEPHAVQPRVPIWVGGRSRRSLRRAVGLADGWMPFGLRPAEIAEMLAGVHIPDGFDVVLPVGPLDPRAGDECLRRLRTLRSAGATGVTCSVAASSVEDYCDQLAGLRALVDEL